MRVWVSSNGTGSASNREPEEHDEIGRLTAKHVLSLQFAVPAAELGSPRPWLRAIRMPERATRERVRREMAKSSDDIPEIEEPDPLDPEDAADIAPLDSETDFDDEQEEDQAPLDETEAAEAGVLLDDPEALSDEEA